MPAVNEKRGLGLILAILGAFALYAVALAPAAKATEVLPTNQQIKMVNNGPIDFLPTNASTNPGIRCAESQFEFTVQYANQRNKNQPGVGQKSTDYGSVITHMDQSSRVPDPPGPRAAIFGECEKWDFRTNQAEGDAVVTTNDQRGAWTVAFITSPGQAPMISVTVPNEAIQITGSGRDCTLSAHPTRGGVITPLMGEWDNPPEGRNDNGQARIDAQIDADGNCQGKTPYQLEGTYEPDREVTVEVRP